MADITICVCEDCPVKEECYRFKAKRDTYQSYANFGYVCNEDSGFCDFIKSDN